MVRKLNRAFTLVEMLIAMTLLALVASAVVLFVTAMSRFSTGNNETIRRIRQEIDLREEFDMWFSLLDCPSTTFTTGLGNTLVRAETPGGSYSVRREGATLENGGTLLFFYPEQIVGGVPAGETVTEVEAADVRSIYFAREGESGFPETDAEEDDIFTFPIATHVNPAQYLCKVIFF